MITMNPEMDKQKLQELMRLEFNFVVRTVAHLDEAALVEPGACGEWTVKDTLAHLAAWHRRCKRWFEASSRGETPELPDRGFTWDTLDKLNAAQLTNDREAAFEEVFAGFQDSFVELVRLVEWMSETDLCKPGRFDWIDGGDAAAVIAHNTYRHYQHHLPRVRRWISLREE